MTEVEEITEDIRDIFCKYKEKQKCDLVRNFNCIRSCDCGHKARICNVQAKLYWYKRMTTFYQIILGTMSVFFLILIYSFWAARRYNRARSFGNGACISTFFWTYDDCMVSF